MSASPMVRMCVLRVPSVVAPPPVSKSMVLDAAMVNVPPLTTPELASMVPVASSARVLPAPIVVAPV